MSEPPTVIYRYVVDMLKPGDLLFHGKNYLLVQFEGRQVYLYNMRTKETHKHYGYSVVGNLYRDGEEVRGMFWALRAWDDD